MNPRCLLPNISSWVNLPTSLSLPPSMVNENLCARYFVILYFFSPPRGSHAMRDRYFHQRQYPLAVIISERENGSLTYARHVRNLQAPFVDASRQCAAPIRMVSPLRMQPPHFHRRQSSGACFFFLRNILYKNTGLSEYGNHKGQLSDMEEVCLRTCGAAAVFCEATWWKQSDGGRIILMVCHQCRVGGVICICFSA